MAGDDNAIDLEGLQQELTEHFMGEDKEEAPPRRMILLPPPLPLPLNKPGRLMPKSPTPPRPPLQKRGKAPRL